MRTDENKIRSLQQERDSQDDQLDALEEDKERFYREMISNQSTKACIESVDSKLNGFVTQLRAVDASQDTAAVELREMKTRFVTSSHCPRGLSSVLKITRVEDLPGRHDFAKLQEQVSGTQTKVSDLERVMKER